MRALCAVLGIDYEQWRVLTLTMLKVDLRSAGNMQWNANAQRSSQRQALFMMGIFYLVTGFLLIAVAFAPDVFLGGTILITVMMFMIGAMVLIEYQSVVISPDDYAILAFQPITSRTYFAVKVTNVAVYVGVLATLMGGPSIVTHTVLGGPWRGLATVVAVYGATAFVTLAMIVAYALVLRFVHPSRLRRVLSYLQMLLSIVMYGGYAIFPRFIDKEALAAMHIDKTVWLLLYPPTWFASLLDLTAGNRGAAEIVPAVAGIAATAALFLYSTERLSLSYAERLADLSSASETPAPRQRDGEVAAETDGRRNPLRRWLMGRDEARAIALLVRAQFRFDMKFRMSVLGMLPLTGLYVYMSLRDGPLPDPFATTGFGGIGQLGMIHMVMIFMPVMLLEGMASSDSFQAAWIFFATPADKARLVLGARSFVLAFFVVPYLIFCGAIFTWFFQTPAHALIHVVVFGLIATLALDIVVLLRPQLPFSKPVQKGKRSGIIFGVIFGSMVFVIGILPFLLTFVYGTSVRIAVTIGLLAAGNVALGHAVARRADQLTSGIEFAG